MLSVRTQRTGAHSGPVETLPDFENAELGGTQRRKPDNENNVAASNTQRTVAVLIALHEIRLGGQTTGQRTLPVQSVQKLFDLGRQLLPQTAVVWFEDGPARFTFQGLQNG